MNVLFRVDGSTEIGLGHVSRCLALAETFADEGFVVGFLTRSLPPLIDKEVRASRHTVFRIRPTCSIEKELEFCQYVCKQTSAEVMVADICNTQMAADLDQYSAYLDKLGRCVDCMVVIDDLTQIRFSASLVVNPNYGIDPNAYRVAPNTKLLLGPEFALFNKAFRMAAVAPKVLKNRVENVLVSMGAGRDIHGAVAKVLTALSSLPDNDLLTLRLVTGLDTSAHERYKNTLSTYKGRYTILANVRNMPELFTWADIAVVSGGLSKYEAALTGTPSLVIAQTEHEVDWMDKFESAETADYVGYAKDISVPMLIDALDHLNTDRQARETMSTRGKALVAGAGVHRIVGEVKALLRSE